MKKIGLLAIAALLTSGVVLGTTSCGSKESEKDPDIVNPEDKPGGDDNKPGEGEGEKDPDTDKVELPAIPEGAFGATFEKEGVKFVAYVTLAKESKDFELAVFGDDGFEAKLPGAYVFEKGFGYTFNFANDNNTYTGTYNTETKSHEFKYTIKLGDLGAQEVVLTLKDETFTPVTLTEELKFVRSTDFRATFNLPEAPKQAAGGPGAGGQPQQPARALVKIKFAEKTFLISGFTSDEKAALHEYDKEGTYVFDNNTFKLTIGDKTYTSTFNLSTREYTIPYEDGITFKYNPTIGEETLSGWVDFKGGVQLDLYMFADGTMFGDATTGMKSMNEAFDGRGTWTQNEDGSRTLNYKVFGQDKVAQVVADPENEGKFKCDYVLTGSEADALVIPLSGTFNKVFNLSGAGSHGNINLDFTVEFNSADKATLKMSGGDQGPKSEEIAYTFENNIITITQTGKETSYASTYDEETGTYKLPFTYISTIPGVGDFDFVTELTYQIW